MLSKFIYIYIVGLRTAMDMNGTHAIWLGIELNERAGAIIVEIQQVGLEMPNLAASCYGHECVDLELGQQMADVSMRSKRSALTS